MQLNNGENVFNIRDLCDKESLIIGDYEPNEEAQGITKIRINNDGASSSINMGFTCSLLHEHYFYIQQLRSDVMILNKKCEELINAVALIKNQIVS